MKLSNKLEYLLFFIWAISLISVAGSLFFSFVLNYQACTLCLIQRFIMGVMVIGLGYGVVTKKIKTVFISLFFSLFGMIVAGYQYILQKTHTNSGQFFCGQVDCTKEYINWFGFITIPFLSFMAFLVILVVSFYIIKKGRLNK